MMRIQFDRLHEQLEWIREDIYRAAHREPAADGMRWAQGLWYKTNNSRARNARGRFARSDETGRVNECDSFGCLAGHAALAAGGVPQTNKSDHYFEYLGLNMAPADIARKWLGLNMQQSDELFHAENTLDDIERIVKEWENGNLQYEHTRE